MPDQAGVRKGLPGRRSGIHRGMLQGERLSGGSQRLPAVEKRGAVRCMGWGRAMESMEAQGGPGSVWQDREHL